jgi:hypothetical protein
MDPLLLQRFLRASIFLVVTLLLSIPSQQVHADVVVLTDATFEHQTQASTGATTGSWLILFTIPTCTSCQQTFRPIFETLDMDEALYDRGIVLGTVDCTENISVCRRFAVTQLPTIVYLHQKKLYAFDTTTTTTTTTTTQQDDNQEEVMIRLLKQFVLSDYTTTAVALPIPDPPSIMDTLMMMESLSTLYDAGTKSPLLGIAIVSLASMLFLTVLVLVFVLVRGSTPKKDPPPKNKTKKS